MPQISKEQIEKISRAYKTLMKQRDAYSVQCAYEGKNETLEVYDMLQGLLDQSEGELVAELLLSRSGHGIVVEWHKTMPVGTKLYTRPTPFTPITADDVTDEMVAVYHTTAFVAKKLS